MTNNKIRYFLLKYGINTHYKMSKLLMQCVSLQSREMNTRWRKFSKARTLLHNARLFKNRPPLPLHEWGNFLAAVVMKVHTVLEHMFCLCKTKTNQIYNIWINKQSEGTRIPSDLPPFWSSAYRLIALKLHAGYSSVGFFFLFFWQKRCSHVKEGHLCSTWCWEEFQNLKGEPRMNDCR